jgi:ATP-binding cassette subfamily F protein 3
MIQLSNIQKSYGSQVLFEDLTFSLHRNERVGLVGRNGHGKTTLFRIILGLEQADDGNVVIPKRYRIGHLDQQLRFTRDTVLEEACLGLPESHKHDTWRAEKILTGLGFAPDRLDVSPDQFSGGYQVRLNLAKVLLSEPDLLLLDEPTNYLDVVSIRWLSRFLCGWRRELMLITHDRTFMDSIVTHTVGIHRKRAKKIQGGTEKLYQQILQEEEIHEKTRLNDAKRRQQIERFIERFRAKNTLATRVQSRIKYLERHEKLEKLERIQVLDFAFNAAPFPTKSMMRVEGVSFGYGSDRDLFQGLSFEILSHDRVFVIGPNGKGKSTLLRLLAGDLEPRRGRVTRHPKLEVGYYTQTNVVSLNPDNDVVDEIRSADGACLPQTARNIAGTMMFEGDAALKRISVLSGGEKSRVMLAKIIVSPSHLLLLDEPTNHLDMDSCDSLLAAVDAFPGAVVMVTHNELFLHSLATRFTVFDRNRVITYSGSYREFLADVGWEMDETPASAQRATTTTPVDRKTARRARARVLQERSRALTPLQARVDDLEARIIALETEVEATDSALAHAAAQAQADLESLSKTSGRLRKEIEGLFGELEEAAGALDEASEDFDRRLQALD